MTVELRPGETFESLLKRFRKDVAKSRILSTYRRKRWFTPPSEERSSWRREMPWTCSRRSDLMACSVSACGWAAGSTW